MQGNFYVNEGRGCNKEPLDRFSDADGKRYSPDMATAAGISLDQFLATRFDPPEPDFVDGEVVERSIPDWIHARLQGKLFGFLDRAEGLVAASELRVRVGEQSYSSSTSARILQGEPCPAIHRHPRLSRLRSSRRTIARPQHQTRCLPEMGCCPRLANRPVVSATQHL